MDGLKPSDLLLLLLFAPKDSYSENDSSVDGITRMTKLLFLLQNDLEKTNLSFEKFKYLPYKMGPFSDDVYSALEFLENFRIPLIKAESKKNSSNQLNPEERKLIQNLSVTTEEELSFDDEQLNKTFSLTEEGRVLAKYFWDSKLNDQERSVFKRIKSTFGKLTLRDLLRYVYQTYPEYTTRSEIKDSLNL